MNAPMVGWYTKIWGGGFQKSGIPDILACVNGVLLAVEVKASNGRPSELQKLNISRINKSGGIGVFANVFNDPIAAIEVLFLDLASNVIGYVTSMAEAIEAVINKIPGVEVDITSGLSDFQQKITDMAANVKSEAEWNEVIETLEYKDPEAAMNEGYEFGEGIEEKISEFDPSYLFDTNVPSVNDYANLSDYNAGLGSIGGGVDDIAGNTGKIADSMDITEEDLKYLRDIAEQEAVNRFTTAEITIEQTNHNTVSGKMDLDGIVSGLTDAANEAVDMIAEGVHE